MAKDNEIIRELKKKFNNSLADMQKNIQKYHIDQEVLILTEQKQMIFV